MNTHNPLMVNRLHTESGPRLIRNGMILLMAALALGITAPQAGAVTPTMTSIFSPDSSVKLEAANGETTSLRRIAKLPRGNFTITTGKRDLVQIRFVDGSYVRIAPDSRVEFDGVREKVNIEKGTAMIYFAPDTRVAVLDMDVRGNDSLVLATQEASGSRVLPIKGSAEFGGKLITEGHIGSAAVGGRVMDIGATDMNRFKNESPILVDLPGSPSLTKLLAVNAAGLQGRIEARDREQRYESSQTLPNMPFFLGSSLADSQGAQAQLAQELPQQTLAMGSVMNPNAEFAQIVAANTTATEAAAAAVFAAAGGGVPPPPPPPPPVGGVTFGAAGWTIDAAGTITFGVGLTLTPTSYAAGGTATYSTLSLTINNAASAAPTIAGFTGTGLTFNASGENGGGALNAFESTVALAMGNISLTLNSSGSTANIALAGVDSGTGSITLTSSAGITSTAGLTAAGGVTTTSGGATTLTTVTTTSATGAGGNVSVTAGGSSTATVTGAITANGATVAQGGKGGNVTVYAGTVSTAAVTANGGTSTTAGNAGGDGGTVNLQAATANLTSGGAITSTGGTGAAAGAAVTGGKGGAAGAVTLTANSGSVLGGGAVTTTGGAGGASAGTQAGGAGGAAGAIAVRAGGAGAASITLGALTSTGGAGGAVAANNETPGHGAVGGSIVLEGGTSGASAAGTITVASARSIGGASDATTAFLKGGAGNGGTGGTVTARTASTLTATVAATGFQSVGGQSAAQTAAAQIVPSAGDGGNVTIVANTIGAGTLITTVGGAGGATTGTTAVPNTTAKAGIGGDAGTVSVTVTGAGAYNPNIVSQGGDAGNFFSQTTGTTASFSSVFNGVGGAGGNISLSQTNPAGTLDLTGTARLASRGGQEIQSALGGSTSNGLNVNGSVAIDVGTSRDLVITSATAVDNRGNGSAAGYDPTANGGLGQFTALNSGTVSINSRDLTINAGGSVNAGGSTVTITSTRTITIDGSAGTQSASGLPLGSGSAIVSNGGTTIANATSMALSGNSTTPGIFNTGGTVTLDVSTGTGGAITLGTGSILSVNQGPSGARIAGNVDITGSGTTQANGQLYGISANALAVIATGTITVDKTPQGSLADVGSAGRQGTVGGSNGGQTSGSTLLTPSYTLAAQSGTANIVPNAPPVVVLSSATVLNTTPNQTALGVRPVPFDDAQHGSAQLTAAAGTQPLLVTTDTAPALPGALHNFSAAPVDQQTATAGVQAQFVTVSEIARTGIAGNTTLYPATVPAAAAANSKVIVAAPANTTVNK